MLNVERIMKNEELGNVELQLSLHNESDYIVM